MAETSAVFFMFFLMQPTMEPHSKTHSQNVAERKLFVG